MYLQVLEMMKNILEPDHPNTLMTMQHLSHTWKDQGRVHEALGMLEDSYQSHIRVLGPEHPDTQAILSAIRRWRMENSNLRKTPETNAEAPVLNPHEDPATVQLHD